MRRVFMLVLLAAQFVAFIALEWTQTHRALAAQNSVASWA